MSKKSGSAGQRAKKKHAREVKRKNVPMKRPSRITLPRAIEARSGWLPADEGLEGLVTRLGIHYHEAAYRAAEHAGVAPTLLPRVVVTPARVAALGTPELLARLGALGVTTDRDAFVGATTAEGSATRFASATWLPLLAASATVHDRDFVRLAACELWKRFRPEAPSTEGLLDLFQLGFDRARKQDEPGTVEIWLDFWTQLRPRISDRRTLAAVNAFFGEHFTSFDGWIEVLLSAAENAAASHPDLVRRTVTLLEEVHQQLSDEDAEYRSMLVQDRVGLLFRTGARDEGERILREIIARDPANVNGYLALAGRLSPDDSDDRGGLIRALAVLEEALEKRAEPGEDWTLDMRIAELRERLAELDAPPA